MELQEIVQRMASGALSLLERFAQGVSTVLNNPNTRSFLQDAGKGVVLLRNALAAWEPEKSVRVPLVPSVAVLGLGVGETMPPSIPEMAYRAMVNTILHLERGEGALCVECGSEGLELLVQLGWVDGATGTLSEQTKGYLDRQGLQPFLEELRRQLGL